MCSCFNYKSNPFNSFLSDLIMLGDWATLTGGCEYKEYTVVNLNLSSVLGDRGLPPRLAEKKPSGTSGRRRLRQKLPISGIFSCVNSLRNAVVSHLAGHEWWQFTQGHTDVTDATAGDWIFMSRAFAFFAKHKDSLHTKSVPKGLCHPARTKRTAEEWGV